MKAVILLCLVAAASASTHPLLQRFMDIDSRGARVVGGQEVSGPTELPYQILLRYNGGFTCGGSIYNEWWIITAAHCIDGRPASTLTVQAGTHIASGDGGDTRRVELAIMHPNYGNFINDIALIKLSEPLVFGDTIRPIKLADDSPGTSVSVRLSGFGRTSDGGSVASILKWVDSRPLSRTNCILGTGITHQGTICFFAEAGQGVCNGDSGGPAVVNNNGTPELVGVANFVVGGCAAGNPDGYANAAFFTEWLLSTIEQNS
jgi:secreted trypsin-like serine protease